MVRGEGLEELRTKVSGLNPSTTAYHEKQSGAGAGAASWYHEAGASGGLSKIETNFFAIFCPVLVFLKIQITVGW